MTGLKEWTSSFGRTVQSWFDQQLNEQKSKGTIAALDGVRALAFLLVFEIHNCSLDKRIRLCVVLWLPGYCCALQSSRWMACAHVFLDPIALARVDLLQPVYLASPAHPDFSRESWPRFAAPESCSDCKFVLDDSIHSFCHFLLFSL